MQIIYTRTIWTDNESDSDSVVSSSSYYCEWDTRSDDNNGPHEEYIHEINNKLENKSINKSENELNDELNTDVIYYTESDTEDEDDEKEERIVIYFIASEHMLTAECPITHERDHCGIAHTRWATHGAKTDINAHPHCDYNSRIALVHNGTISNCTEIKTELRSKGITFKSETDTEVIANLIGYYLDGVENKTTGSNVLTAFELALARLDGSWGIAMISNNNPNKIYTARNGSPLMIGLDSDNGRNFIASEHTSFAKYTRNYISLNEEEMVLVTANDISNEDASSRIRAIEHFRLDDYITTPEPYPTWTEKEIMEQPQAISKALQFGARLSYDDRVVLGGLLSNISYLKEIKNLIITGCGTSLNAGLYGKRLMEYLKSFDTISVIGSGEIISDTFPIGEIRDTTGILAISQSGETKDVLVALNIADSFGIPQFSVVNTVGSAIARQTGCGERMQSHNKSIHITSNNIIINKYMV